MTARRTALALLLLPLAAGAAVPVRAGESGAEAEAFAPDVRESDLRRRLATLASDAYAGRDTTEEGGHRAGEYVAEAFRRAGLVPHGKDGSWFQPYAIPKPVLGEGNLLAVDGPAGRVEFAVERDWNPFSVSAQGEVKAPVVFAGFGITAPERGHDDYAGLDAKGKIVVVLRRNPGWDEQEHAAFLRKLSNAAEHGAAGVLLCNDPRTTSSGGDVIGHWSAAVGAPAGSGRIPFAFVTQEAAGRILAPLGKSLADLDAEIRAHGPRSAAVEGVTVTLRTAIGTTRAENARNVVGFLPVRDPDVLEEVVVVGAHYDHVGLGRFGSLGGAGASGQVHNGADDNGSGTAVLLELADWFAVPRNRPRRSLCFVAFSGEELGLLGSAHYVKAPTVPLDDIVTMVNLDMVGRSRNARLSVGGVGTGTGLKDVVAGANRQRGFAITWDAQGVAPTDSTSFFLHKIPVLWFFTGLHEDYHRPSDDVERIEFAATEKLAMLVRDVVRELAEREDRVTYTEPPAMPRPPVLGVRPAPEQDPRGVPLADATEGGPAATAGLRAGDVIVSVAGHPVRNVPDLMNALSKLQPGKSVKVVVARGEQELTFDVVLGERPR